MAPPWPPASALPRLRAMLSQACATSAACLEAAALRVDAGLDTLSLVFTTDRTSNDPVLTWPAPLAPGGAPRQEHWVLDSFRRDPWGGLAMVASEWHGQAARTDAQRTNRTGNVWKTAASSSRGGNRPGTASSLTCGFGVEPPAGIEPATPSLPWIGGQAPCYPAFSQVAGDRGCRSYVLSRRPPSGARSRLRP